jgi:PAS domain S-box-containing protein
VGARHAKKCSRRGIALKQEHPALAKLISAAAAFVDVEREAFALFDGAGHLMHANPAAAALIGPADTLSMLVPTAASKIAVARDEGEAEIGFGILRITLRRIQARRTEAFLAVFAAPARVITPVPEPIAPIEPVKVSEPLLPELETVTELAAEPVSEPAPAVASLRRLPARFVWQTDEQDQFASVSSELAQVVGAEQAKVIGLDWQTAGDRFEIKDADKVAAAIAKRDTWSGVTVIWPLAASSLARPIELAALPVFDREHKFLGYRGFGVFRDPIARPKQEPKPKAAPAPPPVPPAKEKDETPSPPAVTKKPENVVPLRGAVPPAEIRRPPGLSPSERSAFREIARALGARLEGAKPESLAIPETSAPQLLPGFARTVANGERAVLDRLPLGVVVHRNERVLYANRTLLDWIGVASADAIDAQGGLNRLFAGTPALDPADEGESSRVLAISGAKGEPIPVEARLLTVPWEGETALVYILRRAGAGLDERLQSAELKLREEEATARELRAILDTATDGVIILDHQGRIFGLNRSAEALFGFDSREVEGQNFKILFAPESHRAALDYLDGLASGGVASLLNDGREVIGRVREGGLIPLFMTLGHIGDNARKFCAVFRDITHWKRAEEELIESKRRAERTSSAKSDFLAKISHEIRTPLNAIIGFAEVMMEERFGPMGNERYREYLKDIHASGEHLISLINDLLDLSKIEAGKLELSFARVDLNEVARQCIALMQPQANRERIIIRTSLLPDLPAIVADSRSIRQIVLNLLSNSVKFTPPGGQVIVSTALADSGEVHLRVRDTGVGMSESEVATALEPFRQLSTAGRSGGTGLGLPLTKALTEANRASFAIKSAVNAGTLVEITFPSTRVLAE